MWTHACIQWVYCFKVEDSYICNGNFQQTAFFWGDAPISIFIFFVSGWGMVAFSYSSLLHSSDPSFN